MKETIFDELSTILGLHITRDTVDREVKIIDSTGRLTQRKLLEILIMICKRLDGLEQKGSTV